MHHPGISAPTLLPAGLGAGLAPPWGLGMAMGFMNPAGLQLLNQTKHPEFSGRDDGWQSFKREWVQYEKVVGMAHPMGVSDPMMLKYLEPCLDTATKRRLQKRQEDTPDLTFAHFWEELEREFGKDTTLQHKRAWENVRLELADQRLTLEGWRKFQAEFELLGS